MRFSGLVSGVINFTTSAYYSIFIIFAIMSKGALLYWYQTWAMNYRQISIYASTLVLFMLKIYITVVYDFRLNNHGVTGIICVDNNGLCLGGKC